MAYHIQDVFTFVTLCTLIQQSLGNLQESTFPVLTLSDSAGKSAAKGLPSIDHGDWQDASASVEDHALQAAVADGVVTFVHAAAGMQDKLKQDSTPSTDDIDDEAGIGGLQQASETDSQENNCPGGVQRVESIDDVTCLELE